MAIVAAEWPHDGDDEEGKPTEDERPGDDGERAGRLAFPLLLQLHLGAIVATGRRTVLIVRRRRAPRHVHQTAVQTEHRRRHCVHDVLVVAIRVAAVALGYRPQLGRHRVDGRRRLGRRLEALLADARLGSLVDLQVDDDHEEGRHVEGADGREDRVHQVLADQALDVRLLRRRDLILPAQQRRQGDTYRHRPAECDHSHDPPGRPVLDVVDARHGPVAVQRDGHQVQYGRRAAQHVDEDPRVAHLGSHEPLHADLLDCGQRHDERCHHKVGDGERRDQVIGDAVQVTLQYNSGYDEHVTDDGGEDHQAEYYRREKQMHQAVRLKSQLA